MRLSDLKTGERGIIVKVSGHGSFRKRITEMGFIKGKEVRVILNAPLKDPIEYEIISARARPGHRRLQRQRFPAMQARPMQVMRHRKIQSQNPMPDPAI